MIEIKAPASRKVDGEFQFTIFAAGSIEMGAAVDWQKEFVSSLADEDVLIFNPRRDDWDPTWTQSIDNPKFAEQVNWELDALEEAVLKFFYFDPSTKSPITIGEFYDHASPWDSFVVCPQGFWRRGNIEVVCARREIVLYNTLEEGIAALKTCIREDPYK